MWWWRLRVEDGECRAVAGRFLWWGGSNTGDAQDVRLACAKRLSLRGRPRWRIARRIITGGQHASVTMSLSQGRGFTSCFVFRALLHPLSSAPPRLLPHRIEAVSGLPWSLERRSGPGEPQLLISLFPSSPVKTTLRAEQDDWQMHTQYSPCPLRSTPHVTHGHRSE